MPLKNYGVLKGKAIDVRQGAGSSPHYQVRIIDNTTDYRIAINVESKLAPSELEYALIEHFNHPILAMLEVCPLGYTAIASKPGTGAFDYIRGNLFSRSLMKPLPATVPGLDNDLNDKIDRIMQRAMATEDSVVYALGERWGPEKNIKDKYFGFMPGNGIHDIHMNQSNVGQFVSDDGVWQDGGILINFPEEKQWIALFLKFQSQSWHSDDVTGHKLAGDEGGGDSDLPTSEDPKGLIHIVAALVNSKQSPEVEVVTLLNASPNAVNLKGWALMDSNKKKQFLSGSLAAGECRAIKVEKPVELSNKGGIITIIDDKGLKVDGVSYTKKQASFPGWTIVF